MGYKKRLQRRQHLLHLAEYISLLIFTQSLLKAIIISALHVKWGYFHILLIPICRISICLTLHTDHPIIT